MGDQSGWQPLLCDRAGCHHLVIGRPIVQAADPVLATSMMLDDMKKAVK